MIKLKSKETGDVFHRLNPWVHYTLSAAWIQTQIIKIIGKHADHLTLTVGMHKAEFVF